MSEQNTGKGENVEILKMVSQVVSAYVSKHTIEIENIQAIMQTVFRALKNVQNGVQSFKAVGPLVPAVPVEKSVTEDFIICLEDGKRLQMLKRHLSTVYNMTPEQYKERWGLGPDYPLVAPSYAKRRSKIALETGLGTSKKKKKVVNL